MRDLGPDLHAWFRARLDAEALELLDEDEARRFEEHASTCAACEALLKAYSENRPLSRPDGHIPARIIARWDRAKGRLRGLPRQLVREHLESCAACRQDLEALGYAPILDVVSELEAGAPPDVEDPLPTLDGPHRVVVVQGARRGRWMPWAYGGAAGAAVAVAAMFAFVPNLTTMNPPSPDSTAAIVPAKPPPAVAPAESAGGVLTLPPAAVLRTTTRDGQELVTTVVLGADSRHLHLQLPDLYLPEATSMRIDLFGPDGGRMLSDSPRYEELQGAGTIVLKSPAGAFAPGSYRLVLAPSEQVEGSSLPPIEFSLRVVR